MIGSLAHQTHQTHQTHETMQLEVSSLKSSSISDTQSNQSLLCVKQNSGNNESIWSVVNSTLSSCSCQQTTNDDNSVHHISAHCLNNMIVRKQFRNQSSVTIRTSNVLNYLMSINTSIWNMSMNGPICYLMQFFGTCRKSWINSTKFTRDEKSTSRLPYAETGANNRNHHNYKNYHKSSYFPSLSLNSIFNMYQSLLALVLLISFIFRITEACSSRSTPKPRPPSPTTRPNITFQTYACPEAYAKWYCLNGATCFSVRIGESILYNCECADGYMGQRCEFKDLDGSYLPSRGKVLVETASIASGVTVAVLFMAFISIIYYTRLCLDRRRNGKKFTKCFQC